MIKPLLFAVLIVGGTNAVFTNDGVITYMHPANAEEYDLSDHPIYQPWEYNPDRNFSSERFSNPKASNEYHLAALSPFIDPNFDPTIRYHQLPVSTFDYCDLEHFSNYPKCKI